MKLSFNAIPLWLMKEYLAELGATERAEGLMVADAVLSHPFWSLAEPARSAQFLLGASQRFFCAALPKRETMSPVVGEKSVNDSSTSSRASSQVTVPGTSWSGAKRWAGSPMEEGGKWRRWGY